MHDAESLLDRLADVQRVRATVSKDAVPDLDRVVGYVLRVMRGLDVAKFTDGNDEEVAAALAKVRFVVWWWLPKPSIYFYFMPLVDARK